MFIDCVLMNGRGANDHAMHFDYGANVQHLFFQLGGTCPPMSIAWGGTCPHMPFFIGGGGTCPGGDGGNVIKYNRINGLVGV